MQKPKVLARQKVFIVRFKDLTRWDTRHNQSFATNLKNTKSHTDSTTHEADENLSPSLRGEVEAIHLNPNLDYHADKSARNDDRVSLRNTNVVSNEAIPTPPSTDWEMVTLGEVLQHIDTQNILPQETTFQYLGLEHIQKGGGRYFQPIITNSKSIKSNSIVLKKGYIYYSKLRPYLKKIFYCTSNQKCYASSELVGLKFQADKVYPLFILHCLLSDFVSRQEQATSGARMPRMNINDIKNFKIPLPPLAVQEKIVMQVEQIESKIATTKQHRQELERELECYLESSL